MALTTCVLLLVVVPLLVLGGAVVAVVVVVVLLLLPRSTQHLARCCSVLLPALFWLLLQQCRWRWWCAHVGAFRSGNASRAATSAAAFPDCQCS